MASAYPLPVCARCARGPNKATPRHRSICRHFNGSEVEQNYTTAVHWLQLSADQGNVEALGHLGLCYYWGQGVDEGYAKAVDLFDKSVDSPVRTDGSDRDAHTSESRLSVRALTEFSLGTCYFCSLGVTESAVAAASWFHKANVSASATNLE